MDARVLQGWIEQSCIEEAHARKPGNVYPGQSFPDLTVEDLEKAARAIGPILADSVARPVGETILAAVLASRQVTSSNANLGIILLFVPLTKAVTDEGVDVLALDQVLDSLDVGDAEQAYEAIRQSNAGGLGEAEDQDIAETPTVTLREAMELAAPSDSIALQYVTGMRDVFRIGAMTYQRVLAKGLSKEEAVVWCHLQWMAHYPDSLIARKCGMEVAWESQRRAKRALTAVMGSFDSMGPLPREGFIESAPVARLDQWLREDGNKRNPGTSADLVAASLFVAHAAGLP